MADCSKTEVFLREWERMCKPLGCKECPLGQSNNCFNELCDKFVLGYPQEAIKEVQKWSDKHPRETRQSAFLKHYPNPHIIDGILDICPFKVDIHATCESAKNKNKLCFDCMMEYWLAEVE